MSSAAAWSRASTNAPTGSFQRLRELERGAAAQAIERWRAALPTRLLDGEGLPRAARLAELVLGARGVGEPPVTPGAAAVANAIQHATGARVTELPITAPAVLAALRAAPRSQTGR